MLKRNPGIISTIFLHPTRTKSPLMAASLSAPSISFLSKSLLPTHQPSRTRSHRFVSFAHFFKHPSSPPSPPTQTPEETHQNPKNPKQNRNSKDPKQKTNLPIPKDDLNPKTKTPGLRSQRKAWRESPAGVLRHELDMCSRNRDLTTALRLYDAAVAAGTPLSVHHYNSLLYLCSLPNSGGDDVSSTSGGDEVRSSGVRGLERGFEIFKRMEAEGLEPSEATLTAVARLAAAGRDPALAFNMVERMARAGMQPRLRSYGPALFGFCDSGDVERALQVEAHMDTSGVVPEEPELAALLYLTATKGRSEQVYRLLHRMRTIIRQVSNPTAEIIRQWFCSNAATEAGADDWDENKIKEGVVKRGGGWHGQGWLGTGRWRVGPTEMDEKGVCGQCGARLVCIDIDPSETEGFSRSLASLACERNKRVKADFLQFHEWLDQNGPFSAVIDAANVGLFNRGGVNFSFRQLNHVANGIKRVTKSEKFPLIILGSRRLKGDKAEIPANRRLIETWKSQRAIYPTPPSANDDWYWLYAAVKCRSLIVTNDEMRDHLFQLLGTSFFPRWKEKHQVRLKFSPQGLGFHMPPPYSIAIQESESGSWHIPTITDDDIENPRKWICATRDRLIIDEKIDESYNYSPIPKLSQME